MNIQSLAKEISDKIPELSKKSHLDNQVALEGIIRRHNGVPVRGPETEHRKLTESLQPQTVPLKAEHAAPAENLKEPVPVPIHRVTHAPVHAKEVKHATHTTKKH